MKSCFEKSAGFKRIMSDGLDRIVALKKYSKLRESQNYSKKFTFFLISSNYMNTAVTLNPLMRQKIFCGMIMRLMLEEVLMSGRHMSDE